MFSQFSTISLPHWITVPFQALFSIHEKTKNVEHPEVRDLLSTIKRRRILNFQLKREYLPHQKGSGIDYQGFEAPFLALFSDQTFVSYNAFKEQVGNWEIDVKAAELHMLYETPFRGIDGELSTQHTFKIEFFDGQQLRLVWENPLSNVERTYFLIHEG